MRKIVPIALGLATVALLSGCGKRGYDRARPDEFAVARQAPLVIPPDFALVPPQPGVARVQDSTSQQQTLEALFGSNTARSAVENATINQAGGDAADPGIRSLVGDAATNVVDKGATTRDIVAAPQGDGQDVRVGAQ
ncbi:DUF3035 domain-containing protein [Sphingomonas oligophenolica]|uniref:DUF3035 domain-containing protein n=1 Tax=Sphingomonas oligophenolica TaxID=301154 RepID=A0A502CGT5_9SPHN|nr:DUF3035 domain-containing protein [Sphingomonas oligophenolica]TPG12013.1 DUF3035 domain-containing protein [Sphingomonas oligophenolica]